MLAVDNMFNWIIAKSIALPGLLIAIIFHELAHGYSAYLLGDSTAKNYGRLTLNPISHIDPLGFIMLYVIGFGWAKPVPINPNNFKNRKRDNIIVSLAGSFTNFIIVIITIIVLVISVKLKANDIFISIVYIIMQYNLSFGIFNLLPFPPLDGSKVVASLLPLKYEIKFYQYERYLYAALIVLLITNRIDKILGKLLFIGNSLIMDMINMLIRLI
ncbi:putative zinc metalloprotease [Gottschalkia acidurici 9a]|uniref:Zinc metalloprotease n=1 Tax=Gottschalkia acidurici (strain ATCC 7906 / DSM 604 / BCRC 14475 / CIP 104303 / KCTC 5404 / NCIMB 10678 / 9a) TaxID=1128398 RepID=K0AYU8_GOTA9|nr:site-2 protease family protein [Gottschalkia acidurici]AFS78419.1 putative zinc metalloprotease [Gottschalkia acidurici 9a]